MVNDYHYHDRLHQCQKSKKSGNTLSLKRKTSSKNIRLVVASDIHLGPTNGRRHIRANREKINALKPDIILLPGDIVDWELDPVIRRDLGSYVQVHLSLWSIWNYRKSWIHRWYGASSCVSSRTWDPYIARRYNRGRWSHHSWSRRYFIDEIWQTEKGVMRYPGMSRQEKSDYTPSIISQKALKRKKWRRYTILWSYP